MHEKFERIISMTFPDISNLFILFFLNNLTKSNSQNEVYGTVPVDCRALFPQKITHCTVPILEFLLFTLHTYVIFLIVLNLENGNVNITGNIDTWVHS